MKKEKKDKNFEKRRKSVETFFDIVFWLSLINFIVCFVLKILNIMGIASVDISSTIYLIVSAVATILIFIEARLAHKGNIVAGILGLITGVIYIINGGILSIIIGSLLLIDSIMYIVYCEK